LEFLLASPKLLEFPYYRPYGAVVGQQPRMFVNFRNPFPDPIPWSVGETEVLVTVDSGADVTQLPPHFAERLSVDLNRLTEQKIGTVGRHRIRVYERVSLRAYLCGEWILLPVRFQVEAGGSPVLGRAGVFETLQIAFVERDKVIYGGRPAPPAR
jgi:hypothetical protein